MRARELYKAVIFLHGGHDIALRTFVSLKMAVYIGFVSLWLNHGAVAVAELARGGEPTA